MKALPKSVGIGAGLLGLLSGLVMAYMTGGWIGVLGALGISVGVGGAAASHSLVGTGGTKKNP